MRSALIGAARETEALARSGADNGGVYLRARAVRAWARRGGSPRRAARSPGLSFATGRAHIVRAALEAMAHQAHDLKTAFAADGVDWARLRIDGGMVANDWMAQDLADMLDVTVERPAFAETTALGAAMLAGVGCGLFETLDQAAAMRGAVETFSPNMDADTRSARLAGWSKAVGTVIGST